MTIKVDLLFHASTNKAGGSADQVRTAGWSEGWYSNLAIDPLKANLDFLCRARASLLTSSAAIIGQRFRVVGGGSSSANKQYPGTQTVLGDLPSMALLCTVQGSGVPNVRRFALRGLADARAVEGEYVPSTQMTAGLTWFGNLLASDGWRFKARILTNVKGDIDSISTLGVVVMRSAVTLAVNDKVRFLNVVDDSGASQSGVYLVTAAPDSFHFTVAGYTGAAAHKGFARKEQTDYFTIGAGSFTRGRVITHKVGRGFFQFRGRRSARR
jgi:hypothetical protein